MPVKDSMAWQTWTMRTGGRRQAEQMLVEVKDNLVIAFRLVGRVAARPRIPVKRSPGRPMRRCGSVRAALRRPRRLAQPGLSCFAPPNRGAEFMGQAWFRRAAAFEQMRDPRNALLDLEEVPAVPRCSKCSFSAAELFDRRCFGNPETEPFPESGTRCTSWPVACMKQHVALFRWFKPVQPALAACASSLNVFGACQARLPKTCSTPDTRTSFLKCHISRLVYMRSTPRVCSL